MKKLLLILMLVVGAVTITSRPVMTYAYTDEEKQQAKSWLSAHGYAPTRAGAEQAYQDYMDGKIDVPEADAYLGKDKQKKVEAKKNSTASSNQSNSKSDTDKTNNSSTSTSTKSTEESNQTTQENTQTTKKTSNTTQETKTTTETKKEQKQKEQQKKKEQKQEKKKHATGITIAVAAVVIFALLVLVMRKRM